ncbi:helix-turn-helix transcriptional regulator [Luteibacter anthropi]|uniref:AraC family transcriptional regulator n=1 Tax=Luteibacter anthropi TaxID=564369 RepID=UPI0020329C44|nr:helix-turn-helix transcriptional regulator [Luteibacter anthropi]URX63108.1 helix-turn-helix transcriptional regulator [Luteibacter anthropi]
MSLPPVASAHWLSGWWSVAPEIRDTVMHDHPHGQVFGTTRGLLSVVTHTARWFIGPGQAIWLPPGVPHAASSHGALTGFSMYVLPGAGRDLPAEVFLAGVSPLFLALLERVAQWRGDGAWTPQRERLAATCWDEWTELPRSSLALPMPADARLRRVCDALIATPADRRGQDAWAALATMSARTFVRHFLAETGMDFSSWRQRARLRWAQERLAAGAPVSAVAVDAGYDSLSAFAAAFRRHMGIAPSVYARSLV